VKIDESFIDIVKAGQLVRSVDPILAFRKFQHSLGDFQASLRTFPRELVHISA
jgi:hypothetical protein